MLPSHVPPSTALDGQQSVLPVPSLQATRPELDPPLDLLPPPLDESPPDPVVPPGAASVPVSTCVPVPVVWPPHPTMAAKLTATAPRTMDVGMTLTH